MTSKSTNNPVPDGNLSSITTYKIGVLEAAVHRNLQKYCELVLKQHDLTKMQWMLIGTVLEHGDEGIRLTDLAKELGTTISYITVSVNLLTSRGILQRVENTTDSRSVLVSVTDAYQKTCQEIEQNLRQALRTKVYKHVNQDDLRTYVKVLFQLSAINPDTND